MVMWLIKPNKVDLLVQVIDNSRKPSIRIDTLSTIMAILKYVAHISLSSNDLTEQDKGVILSAAKTESTKKKDRPITTKKLHRVAQHDLCDITSATNSIRAKLFSVPDVCWQGQFESFTAKSTGRQNTIGNGHSTYELKYMLLMHPNNLFISTT
ncbi:hypothetical protein LY76DRAFT_610708 [Colletotrichum caudatum]|nr:hypothetical protein LY76DRAFT_610708 [Colletotrichum caudatum]